jgi:hypothetical protein
MHREPVRAILHAIFVIDYQSFDHHPCPALLTRCIIPTRINK